MEHAAAGKGLRVFDFEIPIFSVRRGVASGLASVVYNLLVGLTDLNKKVSIPYTTEERLRKEFLPWYTASDNVRFYKYPMIQGGMAARFAEEVIYANMRHRSTRILYPNYFLPPHLRNRNDEVSVIVHDCQHRFFPQFFSKRKRMWLDFNFRRTLRNADRIFLISEFEKSQIAKYYGARLADRCRVLYNAIDWNRYNKGEVSTQALKLQDAPYIITVGHQGPHKNTVKVIKAYLKLSERYADFRLVVVGPITAPVREFFESIDPEELKSKVILTGFVSDADLGYLYKHASLFVLASAYEGFGMPAVEAMGFGIPTLVADGTALPEVTLGKADYCAADASEEIWAEAMCQCLEHRKDDSEYQSLAEKVRQRYSPASVARRLLASDVSAG